MGYSPGRAETGQWYLILHLPYSWWYKTFALILGEKLDEIHVHNLSRNGEFLKQLQDIEIKTKSPLDARNPDFQKLNITWMYEPGLHIGIRQAKGQIVFMVRITWVNWYYPSPSLKDFRSWSSMPPKLYLDTRDCLNTLMNWAKCVQPIKTNSVTFWHYLDEAYN